MKDIISKNGRLYYRFEATGFPSEAAAQAAADKWVTDIYVDGKCIFDAERALAARTAVSPGGDIAVSILEWSDQWTTLRIGTASLRLVATSTTPLTPRLKRSRGEFLRGDDERHIVDSYLGEGAYDNEFTTDDKINDALIRGGM